MKNIVVFASGNGSNFEHIVKACKKGVINNAQVVLLVCDKANAKAVNRAKRLGIEVFTAIQNNYSSKEEFENNIIDKLSQYNIDLICLAGYMKIIGNGILNKYENKIINTHPSILPSFKGKDAVEQAMNYGVKVYGITIHYVDNSLDGGKIIAQKTLNYEGNDIDYLKKRLLNIEHKLYIKVINKILENE